MSDPGDNVVLEYLRQIRVVLDKLDSSVRELAVRVGFLEEGQARLEAQYAHISTRLDRVDMRLERLERRVGLIDV
ncbi:MAG TPA: hypothetical protein VG889_16085 [Rhizomicrobium sp.]|nr:hypothetical protein [Rhizomicrobium sp.]